jgi:invasion protein IalB
LSSVEVAAQAGVQIESMAAMKKAQCWFFVRRFIFSFDMSKQQTKNLQAGRLKESFGAWVFRYSCRRAKCLTEPV